jgi:hypothetical protein
VLDPNFTDGNPTVYLSYTYEPPDPLSDIGDEIAQGVVVSYVENAQGVADVGSGKYFLHFVPNSQISKRNS